MAKPFLQGELILAVDFDGTITTNPDMGSIEDMELREDVKEVLGRFHDDGLRLILWTCRAGKALEEAEIFLVSNGMFHYFDTINDQLPEIKEKYEPDVARKIGADFYIDDRNLMGKEINWREIEEFVYGEEKYYGY